MKLKEKSTFMAKIFQGVFTYLKMEESERYHLDISILLYQ